MKSFETKKDDLLKLLHEIEERAGVPHEPISLESSTVSVAPQLNNAVSMPVEAHEAPGGQVRAAAVEIDSGKKEKKHKRKDKKGKERDGGERKEKEPIDIGGDL